MSVLFCNVGWMERYEGLLGGDNISGGGGFVTIEGRGHEICNFSSYKGSLFGYVQAPGAQINLARIEANTVENSIHGVTIIWTATRPNGGSAVVGWYKNATVYRDYQLHPIVPTVIKQNGIDGYWFKASKNSATLLPVDARILDVPRQVKGGMGQSNIWYADSPEAAAFVQKVLAFVEVGGPTAAVPGGIRGPQDQERKAQVEQAAISSCCAHYERLGYEVTSVEKDNVGWDLVATVGNSSLRIEVKGLSGKIFSIELTPNEYVAFASLAPDYRLAVVTDALVEPQLSICRYSSEACDWVIEDHSGKNLSIKIKQSASITCA